jgi:hypothetical protein
MRPVIAEHYVVFRKRRTNTYGNRFLPDAQVHLATHFLLRVSISQRFFDPPYPQHVPEHGE